MQRSRFFVVLQRGERDLRFPCVGAVDGLAVVAEGELGEALGVAGGLGSFGPRVAVAVQADALDSRKRSRWVSGSGRVTSRYAKFSPSGKSWCPFLVSVPAF